MGRISDFIALLRKKPSCGKEDRAGLLAACTRVVMEKSLFLDRNLSLELLSREVGTNRLYLSRALAASGGFSRYINGIRVQYAAGLMASDEGQGLRISEIAEKSGFLSERVMNYYLVKHCGITAREMRRSVLASCQAKNFSTSLMASGKANTATRS